MKKSPKQSVNDLHGFRFDAPEGLASFAEPLPDVIVSLQDLQDSKTGPVLDVTDGHGGPHPFAIHHVLAVMFYPRDDATRREFLALLERARRGSKNNPTRLRPTGAVTTLIQAAVIENRWAGITAGRVFWWLLWLAHQHPPASVKKAVFLVEQEKKECDAEWGGPMSKRRILETWSDYKPVAHLWAVLGRDFAEQHTLRSIFEADTLGQFSNLRQLLAGAEVLRRLGGSLFDLTETWRLSPDLRLPMAEVQFPPLPLWAVSVLKNYRA
jgi:hypothetical protein